MWIDVNERLPERPANYPKCAISKCYYLVALQNGCVKTNGYDFDNNKWMYTASPVTHWMPLPPHRGCCGRGEQEQGE